MGKSLRISPQARALFAVLADEPQAWRHGYEISKLTGLKSGTLYPLLMRLCDQGLLASQWGEPEPGGRPRRHLYRLTASGVGLAHSLAVPSPSVGFGAPLGDPV